MKYAVVTFGCRVNQADSLEIEGDRDGDGAADLGGQAITALAKPLQQHIAAK